MCNGFRGQGVWWECEPYGIMHEVVCLNYWNRWIGNRCASKVIFGIFWGTSQASFLLHYKNCRNWNELYKKPGLALH